MIDAHEVAAGLWVGAFPEPHDLPEIRRRMRADAIVFAARELQPEERDYPGVQVVKAPLVDTIVMTEAEERTAVMASTFVAASLLKGRRVLVTCAQGVNRSALIAGLAMRGAYGMAPAKVIETIRARRQPAIGMTPLCNECFVELLTNASRRATWHGRRGGGPLIVP